MKALKIVGLLSFILLMGNTGDGCDPEKTADAIQRERQEQLAKEGVAQVGLPAIVNYQEMRTFKTIEEMRDKKINTYTYIFSQYLGKFIFVGNSIGFGMSAATQYTNPMRPARANETFEQGNITLPQADPNGLFMPTSAEGTWVLLYDPATKETAPAYFEERLVVVPFKLPDSKVITN